MQNYSPALKTNVNSGPLIFSKGVYNNLPADTPPRQLVQTYPFTDKYYEIMKNETLTGNSLDHGPMQLKAVDFERNFDLSWEMKTGRKLTTIDYVQDTVERWASYVASQDIDASGNKIKKFTELKFLSQSSLAEVATLTGNDLQITVPAGDLKVASEEVTFKTALLNVANILTDPTRTNSFSIVHADRRQAITFMQDGSIEFQVGKADQYGAFHPGQNKVSIDYHGRLCASIISPTIDVLPSLIDGVIKWTLGNNQTVPSSFCLPDIVYTGSNHRVIDNKNYIVDIDLPLHPDSFVFTTLIVNTTSGSTSANVLIDAKKVLSEGQYLVNFNETLTISAGSACALTISKSGAASKYCFQFNLLVNQEQATIAQLDDTFSNNDV